MIILPTSQWVTFYTLIYSKMTDVDLELKENEISLYEDELDMFIDDYNKSKEFRKLLLEKYDARITYEERDECFGMYFWDDVLYMSRDMDDCLEKMFNCIKNAEYSKQLLENQLIWVPF